MAGEWRRWWPWPVVALSGTVLLVSCGSLLGADLGDLAGWVEAVSTAAAFAATVLLLRYEADTRRRDLEERERRQASHISCWLHSADGTATAIRIRNGSDQAVYALTLRGQDPLHSPWHLRDLGPGQTVDIPWKKLADDADVYPYLQFSDTAGVVWYREAYSGSLRRASPAN